MANNGTDLSIYRTTPVVDFTSEDFDSILEDLVSYAQSKYADRWTDFNADQFAVIFAEMIAYVGDLTSFTVNAKLRETFVLSCQRRQNLQNLVRPFGYVIPGASGATVDMELTLNPVGSYPFTITPGQNVFSNGGDGDNAVYFQPAASTLVSSYPIGGKVTVSCLEGELYELGLVGVSNGTPLQRWQFPQQNVLTQNIVLKVGASTWSEVTNFVTQQSTSQVFRIVQTDDGNTYALFGDGVSGAIPATNQEIRATYRVGGGRRGNLNRNVIENKVLAHANILSVTNPVGSTAGDEAQGLRAAKNGVANLFASQDRCVTEADYESAVLRVSGVAKARASYGIPLGSRSVRIWIAPSGGGAPSAALRTSCATFLKTRKMVTNRPSILSAVYRDIRIEVLLHINNSWRPSDVEQVARLGVKNTDGTGLFDFAQLDFEAVARDTNGDEQLLLSSTALQAYFKSLQGSGLDRAEIIQLDVAPLARARPEGNTGNGTVASIALSGRQRRREYYVQLISSAQYAVYERIIGSVSALSDSVLSDYDKVFANEGVSDFTLYKLAPRRDSSTLLPVLSAAGQDITTSGAYSLFALTDVDGEYFLQPNTPVTVNVGSPFTTADGTVSFTVTAGSTAFVAGDSFTLDVYPLVSDIRLRFDEYPNIPNANVTFRTSGGARV